MEEVVPTLEADRARELDAAVQASRAATEALMVDVVAAAERDKAAAVRAQEEEAAAARREEVARIVAAVEAETAAECTRVRETELAKLAVELERDKDAAVTRIKLQQDLETERRKRALRDDREAAIAAAEAEARRQWQEGWEAVVAGEVIESERIADAAKRRIRDELNAQHAAKVRGRGGGGGGAGCASIASLPD
jgi:molybdenum cofactor biosynthesis enzyme MoaA